MNWVDAAALAVIVVSAIVALARGLVRELLGIGAWVGAFFFASATVGLVRDQVRGWIGNPDLADPAAYAGMFLIGLIVLSIVVGMIGGAVRRSIFGAIDRTLGLAFGVLRGVVVIAAAYVVSGWLITSDRWPTQVAQARSIPYAYATANWIVGMMPDNIRPTVPVPPEGRETRSDDLLQATPQGTALNRRSKL